MRKMAERPHHAPDYDPHNRSQQGPVAHPAGKGLERLFTGQGAGLGRVNINTVACG
jgi:hypothetical protein